MTNREMIEEALKDEGLAATEWREDEDGEVAVLGRYRTLEDDDDRGIVGDDPGELTASVVGAEEYRNRRVAYFHQPDGYSPDDSNEVQLEEVEPVG